MMIKVKRPFGYYDTALGIIGRTGENDTRTIDFDCTAALTEYPNANIVCVCLRPGDDEPYTIPLSTDGEHRVLTLASADLEKEGRLTLELRMVDGDKVLKSARFTGTIASSLQGEGDAPGAPVRDTLDRLDAEIKAAQAVVDDIRAKLNAGEFDGPQGPKGDPGSDASVTAENIQSALGYVPVKDVQVAGSSVLADGVANVPIATKTVNGVVRPDFYGIGVSAAGIIYIQNTSNINITNRVQSAPLTAYNLDYAVKAAMCDGKGAAWTDAEQKAARDRIGIPGDYELIEEITISEAIMSFIRESTPDGTPYSLAGFLCVITSPGVDNDVVLNQYIFAGGTSLYNYGVRSVGKKVNEKSVLFACVNNKILHAEQYPVGVNYEFANVPRFAKKFVPDGSPITKVIFNGNIPVNTKISIYGVRA